MKLTLLQSRNNIVIEETRTVLNIYPFDRGGRQMLEAISSRTLTATGDIVLIDSDKVIQAIDPGGASRIITLPAESNDNHGFFIFNIADVSTELLTIKTDGGDIKSIIPPGRSDWLVSTQTLWNTAYDLSKMTSAIDPYCCQYRLTLETGVPISTADQVDKTTLYLTPYKGKNIGIYNGTAWETHSPGQLSLNISAFTASKPYDIFIDPTDTLTGVVWTNETTRATALTLQDGVLVKSGAVTYRYLGTIYMDAAQKCQDTVLNRFVWNYYNRKRKKLKVIDTTNAWTYNTAAWRSANNSTANRVQVVIGIVEDLLELTVRVSVTSTNYYHSVGIGLDVVNSSSADSMTINNLTGMGIQIATLMTALTPGFHFCQWVEYGGGVCAWQGDANYPWHTQSGMIGMVMG